MRAPSFWKDKTLASTALLPIAALYDAVSRSVRARVQPQKVAGRVICVGNLVAGGAGKTPVALALGRMLEQEGNHVQYLSRGYKGNSPDTTLVDPSHHTARNVGDEPLLLAQHLPAWVAKDRVAGARAALENGADIIIMDDGFQNPSLYKDCSLLVIDGQYGLGNERVIPAGPLREKVANAIPRISAIIMVGEDDHQVLRHFPASVPVIHGTIQPCGDTTQFQGRQVIAFCGIARPDKFYRTLQETGCLIRETFSYPDHHPFTAHILQHLLHQAQLHQAMLVTTEKDYVRLPPDMKRHVYALPVEMVFADPAAVLKVVLA